MALRLGTPHWTTFTTGHLTELRDALDAFRDRPDVMELRQGFARRGDQLHTWHRAHSTAIYTTHAVLHSLGVVDEPARLVRNSGRQHFPPPPPAIQSAIDRYRQYLAASGMRKRNIDNIAGSCKRLALFLSERHTDVTTFALLTRPMMEEFCAWMVDYRDIRFGTPVSVETRRQTISNLNVFFRTAAQFGWDETPTIPPLSRHDIPKKIASVPRYLPADQLNAVVDAIRALDNPYKKAANLVARWCGARRSEIRRLELDCLDTYPDGHPRLRIPAGKTYQERSVPLHPEAADALAACVEATRATKLRPLPDEVTGQLTHYVFQARGRLMSLHALFDAALQTACENAGLLDERGSRTVTAHRFRHTVGTQLAEKGARLQTIMGVLGHSSATMSMIYARISDATVLRDYQDALGPGAVIAGPAATAIRNNELSSEAVHWLASNYYKTALELGHCLRLRLPEEGPCECDLFLNCAKFLTTSEYAPRLRQRLGLERQLATDALHRGWPREAERHGLTARRIAGLLDDLDEAMTETPRCGQPTQSDQHDD